MTGGPRAQPEPAERQQHHAEHHRRTSPPRQAHGWRHVPPTHPSGHRPPARQPSGRHRRPPPPSRRHRATPPSRRHRLLTTLPPGQNLPSAQLPSRRRTQTTPHPRGRPGTRPPRDGTTSATRHHGQVPAPPTPSVTATGLHGLRRLDRLSPLTRPHLTTGRDSAAPASSRLTDATLLLRPPGLDRPATTAPALRLLPSLAPGARHPPGRRTIRPPLPARRDRAHTPLPRRPGISAPRRPGIPAPPPRRPSAPPPWRSGIPTPSRRRHGRTFTVFLPGDRSHPADGRHSVAHLLPRWHGPPCLLTGAGEGPRLTDRRCRTARPWSRRHDVHAFPTTSGSFQRLAAPPGHLPRVTAPPGSLPGLPTPPVRLPQVRTRPGRTAGDAWSEVVGVRPAPRRRHEPEPWPPTCRGAAPARWRTGRVLGRAGLRAPHGRATIRPGSSRGTAHVLHGATPTPWPPVRLETGRPALPRRETGSPFRQPGPVR